MLARLPVEATGCVPPGSDDVVVPAPSLVLGVVGVGVELSDGVGDGESDGVGDGESEGVGVAVGDPDGVGVGD